MNLERAVEWRGAFTRLSHRLSSPTISCPIWTAYRVLARECRLAVCVHFLLICFILSPPCHFLGDFFYVFILNTFFSLAGVIFCSWCFCMFADLMQRLRNRDRERERRSGGLRAASRRDRDRWLCLILSTERYISYSWCNFWQHTFKQYHLFYGDFFKYHYLKLLFNNYMKYLSIFRQIKFKQ